MTKLGEIASRLPAFAFPVVAWAPEPGTGKSDDDGVREFLSLRDITTNYFAERDLRLGWIFVDVGGRCWEAVSSCVAGRADPWWARPLPRWIHHPKYRLSLEFAERPPMSFDEVKRRLSAAVTMNPRAYAGGYGQSRREELRLARSLADLIKSEETRAIEGLEPVALWWQWLFWEGRCSRPTFIVAVAVVAIVMWLQTAWHIQMPTYLIILGLCLLFLVSAVIRRLHDMRRTGGWFATWWLFSMVCPQVYEMTNHPTVKAMTVIIWPVATMAALGFMAVAPGTRGPNRYGFAPRWGRLRRVANDRAQP